MLGLLCLVVILLPAATVVPPARAYVPLVLFLALMAAGSLALLAGRILDPGRRVRVTAMLVALIAISVLAREAVLARFEGERWRREGGKPMTLVDQYFHGRRYNPDEILARIDAATGPKLVATTNNLFWDLKPRLDDYRDGVVCIQFRGGLDCADAGEPTLLPFNGIHIIHWNRDGATALLSHVNHRLSLGVAEDALTLESDPERFFKLWSAPVLP